MQTEEIEIEVKKGSVIYWKRKNDTHPTYSKHIVQDVINTNKGILLELADNIWSDYPLRLLLNDIDVIIEKSKAT